MENAHANLILNEVLLLLAAAIVIVALFRYLRLSPVLGYLVAGAAVGPHGAGLIHDVESTAHLAEIGVVFLLFMIGLELSFARLRDMRAQVFGIGSLQMLLTGGLLTGLGATVGMSWQLAAVLGFSLALSSTAIVLQVVEERGEQSSQVGRLALAILILQDLAVVPLLVLIPILARGDVEALPLEIGMAFLKAIGVMTAIILAGRLLLRPFYRMVAQSGSPELFMATTLLVVLGSSFASAQMGLSMALGAFLAGLLVAETEYQHQVEVDVTPFKGLFLGLFFMTVGMHVDVPMVMASYVSILTQTAILIVLKALVIFGLCVALRIRMNIALKTSVFLAQGSEFAFILLGLAQTSGLAQGTIAQPLMVVVTLSMALTPLLAALAERLAARMEQHETARSNIATQDTSDLENHIILAGYGEMGSTLVSMLREERLPFVVVDMDAARVSEGRKQNLPIYYGDAYRTDVLETVGAARAQMLVFALGKTPVMLRAVAQARRHYPHLMILARAPDLAGAERLRRAGASVVVSENLESSLNLGAEMLRTRGVNGHEITRLVEELRNRLCPVTNLGSNLGTVD
jgi:CPA2 family monovalent cation:H+ antiporter-2